MSFNPKKFHRYMSNSKNKDKIAAYQTTYQAAYYRANKDKIAARNAAYYRANKDKIAAYHATYQAANKDKIAAKRKARYVKSARNFVK